MAFQETPTLEVVDRASDKATAKKRLKSAGETSYTIGVGQKIYESLKGTKMGELNNLARANALVAGTLKDDHNIDPEFVAQMDERFPLHRSTKATLDRMTRDLGKARKALTEEVEYQTVNGKIKKTSPAEIVTGKPFIHLSHKLRVNIMITF